MCGICGFYGKKDEKLVRKMTDVLVHRGPDDHGYYVSENVCLGQRRLSIIDLNTGKQPIYNEDNSVVVIYNGEIYNFQEIRDDLVKKKHRFKTKTDTEIIIHAYEEYGEECIRMFNGMFAFVLYDEKKDILFIGRDRLGIKPLYYYYNGKELVFASEVKSILAYGVDVRVNEKAIVDYITYQYISGDKTYFKDVKLLEPGHYIIYGKDGFFKKKYWDITTSLSDKKPSDLKKLLQDTVKRQMISDVPVGTTLSGGFDSGTVTTISSQLQDAKISTFTMGFQEKGRYDERPLAMKVAKNLNVTIYETTIDLDNFHDTLKKIIYHLDDPRNGSPTFSQYFLAELVGKHVKVVLTGHGGDELFAGYHVFKSFHYLDMIKKNPLKIFSLLTLFKSHEFLRGMYFVGFGILDKEVRNTGLFVNFSKKERKKLFTKSFYEKIEKYDPSQMQETKQCSTYTDRALHAYIKVYLSTLLLVQDKMGMAHSIEARVPLCDNEVLDFALSVGMEEKITGNELKYFIKDAMKDELPKELYNKPKKGFPTPFAVWFSGPLKKYLYDILLSEKTIKRGIFNRTYVKEILDKHCNLTVDTPLSLIGVNKIWSILTTEIWFRVFVDNEDGRY